MFLKCIRTFTVIPWTLLNHCLSHDDYFLSVCLTEKNKSAKFPDSISILPVCLAFHYIYVFPLTSEVNEVR